MMSELLLTLSPLSLSSLLAPQTDFLRNYGKLSNARDYVFYFGRTRTFYVQLDLALD